MESQREKPTGFLFAAGTKVSLLSRCSDQLEGRMNPGRQDTFVQRKRPPCFADSREWVGLRSGPSNGLRKHELTAEYSNNNGPEVFFFSFFGR